MQKCQRTSGHSRRPSLPKLSIYAAFRVPEVWRYDGARWHVLLLADDEYAAATESRALPGVTAEGMAALLDESPLADVEWMDKVRQWASTLPRSPGVYSDNE